MKQEKSWQAGEVAVLLDRSSLSPITEETTRPLLARILESTGAPVRLVTFSEQVESDVLLEDAREAPLNYENQSPNFVRAFSHVEQEGSRPRVLLALSSAEGEHYPLDAPPLPLLWVRQRSHALDAPWGALVSRGVEPFLDLPATVLGEAPASQSYRAYTAIPRAPVWTSSAERRRASDPATLSFWEARENPERLASFLQERVEQALAAFRQTGRTFDDLARTSWVIPEMDTLLTFQARLQEEAREALLDRAQESASQALLALRVLGESAEPDLLLSLLKRFGRHEYFAVAVAGHPGAGRDPRVGEKIAHLVDKQGFRRLMHSLALTPALRTHPSVLRLLLQHRSDLGILYPLALAAPPEHFPGLLRDLYQSDSPRRTAPLVGRLLSRAAPEQLAALAPADWAFFLRTEDQALRLQVMTTHARAALSSPGPAPPSRFR